MVHAVYHRGDHRANDIDHDGGYWRAHDPRTPNWYFTADKRAEVLSIWYSEWRQSSDG